MKVTDNDVVYIGNAQIKKIRTPSGLFLNRLTSDARNKAIYITGNKNMEDLLLMKLVQLNFFQTPEFVLFIVV
jgi:hypothetical protein